VTEFLGAYGIHNDAGIEREEQTTLNGTEEKKPAASPVDTKRSK
jgi:hypothetical protein